MRWGRARVVILGATLGACSALTGVNDLEEVGCPSACDGASPQDARADSDGADGITGDGATDVRGEAGADASLEAALDSGAPPLTRSWSLAATTGPTPRHSARMVYADALQKTILFAGNDSGDTNDTWAWDGTAWTELLPAASPPARHGHAFSFDTGRGVAVLYAGAANNAPPPDTWEFDGTGWKEEPMSLGGPQMQNACALTYDPRRAVTVLFGGAIIIGPGMGMPTNQTWEWNGVAWTQRTFAASPAPRTSHVLVYDAARQVVLLYGGSGQNDTWTYDGNAWTQQLPATTFPARQGLCGAYDAERGVTVIFGGSPDFRTPPYAETWEFDGTDWKQAATGGAASPPARRTCTMAFDAARKEIVMFGGTLGDTDAGTYVVSGETWVYK